MRLKKFIAIIAVFVMSLTTTVGVTYAADETSLSNKTTEVVATNKGVSFTCPESSIQIRSTSRPSKVWDISSKGSYEFGGTSSYQTLYTNYNFKGQTEYTVNVENNSDKELIVKAKRLTKTYADVRVGAGKSSTFTVSSIKSDTEFYLTFDGKDMAFSGNIE